MAAPLPGSYLQEQSAYLRQVSTELRKDIQELKRFLREQQQTSGTLDLRLLLELAELNHRLVLANELVSQLLPPLLRTPSPIRKETEQ
jgi:hypothetical protein